MTKLATTGEIGGGGGGAGGTPRHTVPAGRLTAEHIGATIRFDQRLKPGEVAAVITAELRQVYHTGNDTTINVCPHDTDYSGDLWEATLEHDYLVDVL